MRSLYRGILGFGLVSIPIQLFKALEHDRLESHWIHRVCKSRVTYQKYCPVCERPLSADEIDKATVRPDGQWVVVPPKPVAPRDHVITIINFPTLADIDPVYYESAYWLKPGDGGQKAYALLLRTMHETGRVALATLQLKDEPRLAMVRPYNDRTLVLHRLHYPDALRAEGAMLGPEASEVSAKELDLAKTLIDYMADTFRPEDYPNQYRLQRLQELEALEPVAVAAAPAVGHPREVVDLMERLRASVAQRHGVGS
ncbi:MAG: Ku domain-containing protein [Firmicutes bacterium]|nr:Ku domain-containing protein [Bacillota bacterium]